MAVLEQRQTLRNTMKTLICFVRNISFILMFVTFEIRASSSAKFAQLANEDVKFDTAISFHVEHSLVGCTKLCVETPGCYYISYQSDERLCNLHAGNGKLTSSPGWKLYFKVFGETGKTQKDLKAGATAFQSSTFDGLLASLALDGNIDGVLNHDSCAHTSTGTNTYWMMQLGVPGVVGKVVIYLRTDFVERNTNRAVLVAQSYDDGVNNVGIECGRYEGPFITTPPFRMSFSCPRPIFGEFVRITMLTDDYMEVCEVFVYTQ